MTALRIAQYVFVLFGALVAAGCQYSPGMVDRTVAFNEAVADSSNQILLLNIVRASRRYPTYYSKLQGATAIGTLTPQLQLTIPLANASTGTLTPQFQATESNQLSLQALDDQKYIRGMMTPIGADLYRYFEETGRSQEMLGLVFIQRMEIPRASLKPIRDNVKAECQGQRPKSAQCEALKPTDPSGPLETCLSDNALPMFINNAASGGAKCFQAALRALLVLGLQTVDKKKSVTVVQKGLPTVLRNDAKFVDTLISNNLVMVRIPGNGLAICKMEGGGATFELGRWPGQVLPAAAREGAEQQCLAASQGIQQSKARTTSPETLGSGVYELSSPIVQRVEVTKGRGKRARKLVKTISVAEAKVSIALRSTEAIIYYLGQIARANTELGDSSPVTTIERRSDEDVEIPLFKVVRDTGDAESAVAVEFEGETYSIPAICDGKCKPHENCDAQCQSERLYSIERPVHRSLDVLTLVNQLWGLQKEATTQPPAPAVTVINP